LPDVTDQLARYGRAVREHVLTLDMGNVPALAEEVRTDSSDPPVLEQLGAHTELVQVASRRESRRVWIGAVAFVVIVTLIGLAAVNGFRDDTAKPAAGEVCVRDPGSFVGPGDKTFGPLSNNNESTGPDDTPGWPVIRDEVPDFVRVTCVDGGGVIGWVRASDLLPQLFGPPLASLGDGGGSRTHMCDADGNDVGTLQTSPRYPVFSDDGATVVGHIYPPLGYVPLGEEPRAYPDRNGLRPCNGDFTALTTQPAASKAQLAWPNAVNHDVTYDDQFTSLCDGASPDGGDLDLLGIADDYERVKYVTCVDDARSRAAQFAKARGKPYNPADLLPPLRDEAGRIVGYNAVNTRRPLTVREVNDPHFDLCAIQRADNPGNNIGC